MFRIHVDGRALIAVALVTAALPLASHCHAAAVVPMIAQAGAALVQPGGLQGLAQGAANPAARPEMVQADPQAAEPKPADAAPATAASPFEIRYLIAYLMMLIFIGGGTGLVVRPTGRTRQDQGKAAATPKPAATKK